MSGAYRTLVFLMFMVSGFCGLLYQVVWVRTAFASFGIVTPVLSVVLSTFMAGIFVGSWVSGRYVEKLAKKFRKSSGIFYAASELGIALGAVFVPLCFRAGADLLLDVGETNSFQYLFKSALVITVSILPSCVFMGATTPLMMAFLKERFDNTQTSFSFLYVANVIGAMFGTLVTALILIEKYGFGGTTLIAITLNVAIAVIALGLTATLHTKGKSLEKLGKTHAFSAEPWGLGLLFVGGFTSMAMEVVWTRAFTVVLQTQVYSFALLLFVYLLSTWLGSSLYRLNLANNSVWDTHTLLGALSLSALLPIVLNHPGFHFRALGALISIVPFCFLLGYLTPKLIDSLSLGSPRVAGRLYGVNVVGCVLGPLIASYLLLPLCGVKTSLYLLALPYIVAFALHFRSSKLQRRFLVPLALLLILSVFAESYETRTFSYKGGGRIKRDHTATVIAFGEGMDKRLLVNGIGITGLGNVTKLMAHLPSSIRPAQKSLVICFGMGTTFRSLLSWGQDVTAVELVPSVAKTFDYFFADAHTLLENPRAHIVIDDGRRFLKRTSSRFDVITLDPPPPVEAAGSSLLYSREFYTLAKSRMSETGILQQWLPHSEEETFIAVYASIKDSFSHVRVLQEHAGKGHHFLASMTPFELPNAREFVERMPSAARNDLSEWLSSEKELETYTAAVLSGESTSLNFAQLDIHPRITDDKPYNEYYFLRRGGRGMGVVISGLGHGG